MQLSIETMAAGSRSAIEASLGLARSQFAALERLAALNINAGKGVVEDAVLHTRRLIDSGDLQQWLEANASTAQPAMEKSIAYWRSVYDVLVQSQTEISRLAEDQADDFSERAVRLAEEWSEKSLAGCGMALDAFKRLIGGGRSAYETLSRISQQAGGLADAGFTAAINSVKNSALKPKDD